jgi:hypothetical protein
MLVYLAAGGVAALLLLWWLRRRRVAALWLSLTAVALLLTPAYPEPGAETLAPALVVAAFQLLTAGVDAAMHALRPLGLALGIAWVLALLLSLLLRRRRSS